MAFTEKLNLAKIALVRSCKKLITKNWEQMFDMWLSCEADMSYAYQHEFKEQFSEYMNPEIESKLWFAGENIVFAICTFMEVKKNAKLKDVLDFTEKFILNQLHDSSWLDDIMMAMPDEEEEIDNNPS
jgi:hypothetical protein